MARNREIGETSSNAADNGSNSNINTANSNAPLRRRNDPLLIMCRCFSLITAVSSVLCIAVNVLAAVRSFKSGSDVFDGIFRCYAVAIGVFTVVVETEWTVIVKFWKVLEYWAGRGMLQILYVYKHLRNADLLLQLKLGCVFQFCICTSSFKLFMSACLQPPHEPVLGDGI